MQCSVRGKRDLQTITGKASAASVGEIIKAQGEWSLHHSHGMQFVASQIQTFPPQTPEGITRYLSACIKGLGPVYAKRCVDTFGTRILEILDHSPDLLSSVRGLSERKIQDITTSWNERRSVRDIMIFLHGVSNSTVKLSRLSI